MIKLLLGTMPTVHLESHNMFFCLFMSPSKFKRVSEYLQTSLSVAGAERSSGASTTPTCVGARSPDPKPASYTHTCTYACMHARTHTNSCTKTRQVCMNTWNAEKHTQSWCWGVSLRSRSKGKLLKTYLTLSSSLLYYNLLCALCYPVLFWLTVLSFPSHALFFFSFSLSSSNSPHLFAFSISVQVSFPISAHYSSPSVFLPPCSS